MLPLPFSKNPLKQKLAHGKTTWGLWVTLESPSITEMAVMLGYDWVVIDAEHGHLDFKEILEHIRATRNSNTVPLVRVAEIQQGLIKRVLDLGAAGILVPQVTSAEEVARAVRFAKYPPWGIRGIGGERATAWGTQLEAVRDMNAETMVIPLLETVQAGECLDAILEIKGIDAIFFGPADYSASAGYPGSWEGPGIAERILDNQRRIAARGVATGVLARSIEDGRQRRKQGFRMIAAGADASLLMRRAGEMLTGLKSDG